MQHFPINWLVLLVAAVMRFLFGWLWYSAFLFGKSWMALTNCTPEEMKRRMPVLAPTDLICNFVMAFVLVHAVHYAGAVGSGQGAAVGFFNWDSSQPSCLPLPSTKSVRQSYFGLIAGFK